MKILLFAIAFSGIALNLFGVDFMNTYFYNASYVDENVSSVTTNGSLFLKNTIVSDSVSVNGMLYSVLSDLGSLQINGECKLEDTTIRGNSLVNGSFTANRCHFLGGLSVASEITYLENSTASQVVIRRISNSDSVQSLMISGKSLIRGDIVFESGQGNVVIKGDIEIQGDVVGGTVTHK